MSNRHICIPELTLKKFNNGGKNNEPLYYYDIANKNIGEATHACFMTEPDYYSPDVDKILSDRIETKMGSLYGRIEKAITNKEILPKTIRNLHDIAKKIVAIQFLRNPDYTRKHTLPHLSVLPYRGRKGAREYAMKILEDDKKYEGYLNIFCSVNKLDIYRSMILINTTNRDFFLPTTHLYTIPHIVGIGSDLFVIIISPKMAWILIQMDDYNKNVKDNNGEVIPRLNTQEGIEIMNYLAYRFESKYGTGKIVSTQAELKNFNLANYEEFNMMLNSRHSELFIETH